MIPASMRRQPLRAATRSVIEVLTTTYVTWRDDRCVRLGAGLAYYGMFALVPLLTLSIVLAGLVFSTEDVQALLAEGLATLLGQDVEHVAAGIAEGVTASHVTTNLGLVGLAALVISGSLLFVALQDALNQIWGVPHRSGIRPGLRRRLLAFAIVFVTIGLVIAVLAIQTIVRLLGDLLPQQSPLVTLATSLVASLAPIAALAVALTALFALLPRARVDRRAAVIGGVLTAGTMSLGAGAVGWYLQRFGTSSVQGAASSVFLLLTAIYIEAQIVLAGAELTKVLTLRTRQGEVRGPPGDATPPSRGSPAEKRPRELERADE